MLTALLASLPWAAVLVYVLHVHAQDSAEWRKERRDLLNRIQAPEAAQKQAAIEIPQIPDEPPYVGWDNDEEFHEARTQVIADG